MTAFGAYAVHLFGLVSGLMLLARLQPDRTGWRLAVVVSLLLSGTMALFLLRMSDPVSVLEDFRQAYYLAGVAVQTSPGALGPIIERGVHGFVNLPIVAYAFWPFGLMSAYWASATYSAIGVCFVLLAWRLLVRLAALDQRQAGMLLFLFAGSGPLVYGFKEGNTSHFLLALLALALTWLRQAREISAGALLGLAGVIKPPLLLVGIYFLLRGRWRVVLGGVVVCVVTVLLSISVFGWAMHERWYELCIRPYGQGPLAAFNVQSVQAFVLRLQVGPEGLFDWDPKLLTEPFSTLSTFLLVSLWATVVWRLRHAAEQDRDGSATPSRLETDLMVVVILACVSSPVSWSHYYTWLLIPAAFFLADGSLLRRSRMSRWLGWVGLVLLATPVITIRWESEWMGALYRILLVSQLLLGGLLWLALLLRARGQAGAGVPRPAALD